MKPDRVKNFYKVYEACYMYGSRVYGTFQHDSDWDYLGIKESANSGKVYFQANINFREMSREHFQSLVDRHNIFALECLFAPERFVISKPQIPWNFELDLKKLRTSVSGKANHSWVKAKKKMVSPYEWADNEFIRGKKSLFHSFRILHFGIQIAQHGCIIDYCEANDIFEDIITNPSKDWDDYYKQWKKYHNQLFSEFRRLAPK